MKSALCVVAFLMATMALGAETAETKFIADTLLIQADGTYEADPDLATMTFQVFSQEKELSKAYTAAAQSMSRIADLAQKNGLKKEDVIVAVNGKEVDGRSLRLNVGSMMPGTTVDLKVLRGATEHHFTVKLDAMPNDSRRG